MARLRKLTSPTTVIWEGDVDKLYIDEATSFILGDERSDWRKFTFSIWAFSESMIIGTIALPRSRFRLWLLKKAIRRFGGIHMFMPINKEG